MKLRRKVDLFRVIYKISIAVGAYIGLGIVGDNDLLINTPAYVYVMFAVNAVVGFAAYKYYRLLKTRRDNIIYNRMERLRIKEMVNNL